LLPGESKLNSWPGLGWEFNNNKKSAYPRRAYHRVPKKIHGLLSNKDIMISCWKKKMGKFQIYPRRAYHRVSEF
jgi:hypothetical protein